MNIFGIIVAIVVALAVYGGLNYYLYRKTQAVLNVSHRLLAVVITLTASSLLLSQWMLHNGYSDYVQPLSWLASLWLGFLFLFLSWHAGIDLIWLILRRSSNNIHWSSRARTATVFVLVIISTIAGLYNAQRVHVAMVNMRSAKVTAPLTIVQISDLHLGELSQLSQVQKLVTAINELKPDIIVSTGDLIDMQLDQLEAYEQVLMRLTAKLGKYAISGNHEAYAGVDKFATFARRSGFALLENSAVRSGEVIIAGIDDPAVAGRLKEPADTESNLLLPYAGQFVVLLKHQPIVKNPALFDLQLSGHTHGGQIFPFGLLTYLVYRQPLGLSRLSENSWLYNSHGAGTWGPPMRILADPEITFIRLLPE